EIHARPAHGEVEFSAGGQDGVADGLGFQLAAVHAPEELVAAVDGVEGLVEMGRLPVGGAGHDLTVEPLEGLALIEEIRGEPLQQFGMGGWRAHAAEIVGGGDDALAEVIVPDPVYDGA